MIKSGQGDTGADGSKIKKPEIAFGRRKPVPGGGSPGSAKMSIIERGSSPSRVHLPNIESGSSEKLRRLRQDAFYTDLDVKIMGAGHTGQSPLRAKLP